MWPTGSAWPAYGVAGPVPMRRSFHLWHTPGKQPASRFPRDALAVRAPSGLHELAVELESVS